MHLPASNPSVSIEIPTAFAAPLLKWWVYTYIRFLTCRVLRKSHHLLLHHRL